MEATNNATKAYAGMEPYNVEYYIAKYGTVENLTNDYIGAIDGLRMQYRLYETNPRKGGRYRREKMEHLRQQAEAIYDELLRVSRAMKEYFAATPTETPQISTETADTVNVSAEGEKGAERAENKAVEKAKTWLCPNNTFDIQPYGKNKALYICVDMDTPPRYHVMVAFWEKNSRYEGGKRFTNRQIDMDGEECYFDGSSFPTLQAAREFVARLPSEPPQSSETPQTAECTTDTPEPRETAGKRQNRAIGSAQATRRDTLRDTLRPVTYVPRECSTADAVYW